MSCMPTPPIWKSGGGYPGLVPAAGLTSPAVLADVYNLWVANNVATPNTKIDLKVGPAASKFEVIAENGSAVAAVLSSSSTITINAGTTGANGLDTGSQTSSTWYYIFVIYNGTTVAGLLSTSSTAPTLPGGYTYSALVGAVRSDGSTHFVPFNQFGKIVGLTTPVNVFTAQAGVASFTSQSVSTIVPPTANVLKGTMGCSTASAQADYAIEVAGDSSGTDTQLFSVAGCSGVATASFSYRIACPFRVQMITAQTFYWKAPNTNPSFRLDVTGWEYP